MKRRIRLTEGDLRKIVRESVGRILTEAESEGWVVENDEALEAYDFACEMFGKEKLDSEIVNSLGTEELAECLAYIFRMYDFDEWKQHKEGREAEEFNNEDEDI